MSKRYRLLIVLLVLGICFLFLLPSIRWYFFTPIDQQIMAQITREQISRYVKETAAEDLNRLYTAARNNDPIPEGLEFLTTSAQKVLKDLKIEIPDSWIEQIEYAYPTESKLREVIEEKYLNEILAVRSLHQNAVKLGLDLSGGLSIVLEANIREGDDPADAMKRALEVLNGRIDQFGLTEPVIRRQGDDQIYIEIPGTADPERINDIVMGKGSLAFHLVDTEATEEFRMTGMVSNPDSVMVLGVYKKDQYGLDVQNTNPDGSLQYIAVNREVGLDGNYIVNARVERGDPMDPKPQIRFDLSSEGGDIFYQLTSENINRPLAIILDNRIRDNPPVIRSALRDGGVISGFRQDEAENLALILRTAALPVELKVVSQQSIGAAMGEDTIRQGLYALIGGIIAVFIFMLVYYKISGFIAIIAQLLNFYIMFSVLSALNFTLTLPAIAGFILTIGMAVDASVIIFERMKEEMRLNKSRAAVVEAGFNKAFWAIMDANITTFIAALFLSQLGSGPIRGFAVSLAIGVFSSVFTSLFVSRLFFDFGTDVLKSRKVSISWGVKINNEMGVKA